MKGADRMSRDPHYPCLGIVSSLAVLIFLALLLDLWSRISNSPISPDILREFPYYSMIATSFPEFRPAMERLGATFE